MLIVCQFKEGEVTHMFKNKMYHFKFQYRDPWQWVLDTISDPMLGESIMWYPIRKILHDKGRISPIYDDLNTGIRWWEIQVCFYI